MRQPSGYGAMKTRNSLQKNLTADYSIDPLKDIGVTFTNTGASADVNVTLPDATVGQVYRARVTETTATYKIKFTPQSSDDINLISGVADSDGDYIISNGDGNESIELTCFTAGHWTATEQLGTWAQEA